MTASTPKRTAVQVLCHFAGILCGILFVGLFYPAALLFCVWISARTAGYGIGPRLLLAGLCLAGLVLFFWLQGRVSRLLGIRDVAFPLGVFLAADFLMLSFPLFKLLDAARLMEWAGGNRELATQIARLSGILIPGLVVLVLSWLFSVLWKLFRKFTRMSEMLSARISADGNAPSAGTDAPASAPNDGNLSQTPASDSQNGEGEHR